MISLKLTDIAITKEQEANLKRSYLYKDVILDLKQDVWHTNAINRNIALNDIQAFYDIEAVKNSIANCFLTSPGQRILYPEYGIDLRRFLFSPISDGTAYFITRTIEDSLPIFEPRIEVVNVRVVPDEDNNQYDVFLQINVPSLDIFGLILKNYLNSNGYF